MRDFNHSVNVLVKAYLNNTLEHGNCHACAVGNLIADANGISFVKYISRYSHVLRWNNINTPSWSSVFYTNHYNQTIELDEYKGFAKLEIDSTGYSVIELAKIEYAFESAPIGKSEDDYMFNGLMACVEVLAEIHNIDLTEKEKAKALFVKH